MGWHEWTGEGRAKGWEKYEVVKKIEHFYKAKRAQNFINLNSKQKPCHSDL